MLFKSAWFPGPGQMRADPILLSLSSSHNLILEREHMVPHKRAIIKVYGRGGRLKVFIPRRGCSGT